MENPSKKKEQISLNSRFPQWSEGVKPEKVSNLHKGLPEQIWKRDFIRKLVNEKAKREKEGKLQNLWGQNSKKVFS